jgi:hypothetical protein
MGTYRHKDQRALIFLVFIIMNISGLSGAEFVDILHYELILTMTQSENFMAFGAYFYVDIREMDSNRKIYEYFFH